MTLEGAECGVYQIDGKYSPNQAVPPEAIMGAWKVDSNGDLHGNFLPNPNYKPKQEDK